MWEISTLVRGCCRVSYVFLFCGTSCMAFTPDIVCIHIGLYSFSCKVGCLILIIIIILRFLHYVAVVWCFGYLGFFRTCHYFGFSQVTPVANIVQLLLTLRVRIFMCLLIYNQLIGASFEISDSWRINNQLQHSDLHPQDKSKLELLKKYKCIEPSPLMIMLYAYCYIGLFTGKKFYLCLIKFSINMIKRVSRFFSSNVHMHASAKPTTFIYC